MKRNKKEDLLGYEIKIIPDRESGYFAIRFPDFPGIVTGGYSLEEAIKNAQDSSFLEKLKREATLSAQTETSEIFFLLKDFKKLKGSHLLARLRSIRNQLFAHTTIEQKWDNPAQYGDAEKLLEKTIQFVSRLNSAVRSLHCTY